MEGPSSGDTSVLDYNGTASIKAGTFIGTGGAGMAANFSSAEQGLIAVNAGNQSAGSTVTLKDASGDVIAETTPGLDYAVVYVSTQDMTKGETYSLTAGSYSESITLTDNLYSTLSGGMQGSFGGGGPRGEMNGNGQMQDNRAGGFEGGASGGMNGQGPSGEMKGGPGGMKGQRPSGDMNGGSGEMPDAVTGATQISGNAAA